jgi:hypothetical protein
MICSPKTPTPRLCHKCPLIGAHNALTPPMVGALHTRDMIMPYKKHF